MMKNKKMGILAVLVMLVAVTLNAVGGTYAKYISTYGTTDEARVAKWNFVDKSVNTVDLFKQSYTKTTEDDGTYAYVASSDAWKVIAPGTNGVYEYQIEGTAETNFKVSQVLNIVNNVKLDNGYDPLEFRINDGQWVKASEVTAVDDETVYPANANITVGGKIEWRWEFETGNDDFDTELGSLAVENNLTVMVSIGATVEQTQDAPTAANKAMAPLAYAGLTNKLSAEQKKDLVEIGYKTQNASTTFNGSVLAGKVKAYEADDKLVEWYNVNPLDTNYFVALSVKVPAHSKLVNPTAYGASTEDPKVIKDNTSDEDIEFAMILNVRDLKGKYVYGLVDANNNRKDYTVTYDLEPMA